MIQYIKGVLTYKNESFIVVENQGMGYKVFVPSNSIFYTKDEGEEITVHTVMIFKEDDVSIYGFEDMEAIELFNKLITVNGVGAKAAMAIFSTMSCSDIKKAIVYEDVAMITKANGIGKKTAQRIVLDLKDKFENVTYGGYDVPAQTFVKKSGNRDEAIDALMELGYSKVEATEAIGRIQDDDLSVEEYIKLGLRGF